jgi:hypothetical protein
MMLWPKRLAKESKDEKLLVKVFSGSAGEAKYHAKCLVALYSAADRASDQTDSQETKAHALCHVHLQSLLPSLKTQRSKFSCF